MILVVVLGGVAVSLLAWKAHTDPAINYLPHHRDAEWIIFPTAVDARGHLAASLDTTFRHEFTLQHKPVSARLALRAMCRAELKVDGASIELPHVRNWKDVSDVDITGQLRDGTNTIEVRVFNQNGPPALWLVLDADQLNVGTGRTWQASFAGSSWRNAVLASEERIPGPGNPSASRETTSDAAKKLWPLWILLIGIACAGVILWRTNWKHFKPESLEVTVILLVSVVWSFLCWNNTRLLPFHAGFDSKEHLKYIEYVQQHWSVPSPSEGFEMYHPPLYYFIAASILSFCKLSINDPGSVFALRALGTFCGIAQCILVFLSLRLLLPAIAAMIGLVLAAFLPMHLYMMHYVTNELLAATLATLTIYLSLRLLQTEAPRALQFAFVGLALGASMLTKATGVVLFPIVVIAICATYAHTKAPFAVWLRSIGLLIATSLAVCGWYYARIWLTFGTPLLSNWDVTSGFAWWQDPGYQTAADFIRFGRSLITPLFSGFAGFADGMYSTSWGDGLSGGASSVNVAWNLGPMIAGYLWAVVPTALIFLGAVIAIVRFVRRPSAELFLLLALSAGVAFGLSLMRLKVPSYAQAKAFYGLSFLTPLCFFGALGWKVLTNKWKPLGYIIGTVLVVWALNSLVTFCIVPSVSHYLYAVKVLGPQGKIEQAAKEAAKAVEADPFNAAAHSYRALSVSALGNDAEAVKDAERGVELAPSDSMVHLNLAIATKRNDMERAIAEARRAIELGPENFSAYEMLMTCLLESGQYNHAATVGPEWLAISPFEVTAHSSLAMAAAQSGDLAAAARQFGYVMMLRPSAEEPHAQLHQIVLSMAKAPDGLQQLRQLAADAPDSPRMLDELAWLLATFPDSNVRDGNEAVRVAERACNLTNRRVPAFLATLAAAYAEAGDFSRAVASAEEAVSKARSLNDTEVMRLSETILASVRENAPYRNQPE
jgi:tetratricopeptide (TPR) repeat protein